MEATKYGDTALEIIGSSKILTTQDLDVIQDLKEELGENFRVAQVFRTRTEMEVSVLNDMNFPTPDSKYWQSQREQNVHFHGLVMLSYEYRKNLVEIRQLQKRLRLLPDEEINEDARELLVIEIEKKTFIARNQERAAKDRIREIREWHEIKARLIPQMAHSLEDVDEHQLVSYTRRFIYQWITMGSSGSPGERQNLLSQMDMSIRACISKGVIGPILQDLSPTYQQQICSKYGISTKELMGR